MSEKKEKKLEEAPVENLPEAPVETSENQVKKALKLGTLIKIKVKNGEDIITEPILTQEKVDETAKKLDSIIKLKGIPEAIDGLFFKFCLTYINNNYSHLASKKLKEAIQLVIEGFLEDDYSKISTAVAKAIQGIVNLPQLDDDLEGKFYALAIQALFQFAQYYAAKKK